MSQRRVSVDSETQSLSQDDRVSDSKRVESSGFHKDSVAQWVVVVIGVESIAVEVLEDRMCLQGWILGDFDVANWIAGAFMNLYLDVLCSGNISVQSGPNELLETAETVMQVNVVATESNIANPGNNLPGVCVDGVRARNETILEELSHLSAVTVDAGMVPLLRCYTECERAAEEAEIVDDHVDKSMDRASDVVVVN